MFAKAAGPNEKMEISELKSVIRRICASNSGMDVSPNVQDLFANFDTDASGFIDIDEFLALYAALFGKKGTKDKVTVHPSPAVHCILDSQP